MRVLVTSRLYPSSSSPVRGTFVHEQVRFLGSHCRIEVVSPTPLSLPVPGFGRWTAYGRVGRLEVRDGIEIRYPRYLSLPRRLLFSHAWRFYLAALGRAARTPPDLIHAHLAYPDGMAAVEYGRRLGCPVVISVHGHDVREIPRANPRWRGLVARALARAAAVIVSSGDVRERVRALGVEEERIHAIPQGVDCRLFTTGPGRPGRGGPWRILYVGRHDRRKGLDVLLEAMHRLRQDGRDLQLRLVGGSPVSGTAEEYRRKVDALALADCVEFVEEQPHEAIPGFMAEADLFVLPSFYDSFGIVVAEAMACGLPVVATRCGGPEELVEEESGKLVPTGDAEGLASGILEVIESYGRYDREAIRARAEARWDLRKVAERIHSVYEETLDGGSF